MNDESDFMTVITKPELKRLNERAIKRNYNRSLKPELVDRLPDVFQPTGNPTRFNFEESHESCCVGPDCVRLVIYLPADPKDTSQKFVPAWLDVKRNELKGLVVKVPRRTGAI